MKVTNWRRKLAASLVAGGLITPAAAQTLDTNLVVNGTFESVDLGVTGDYGAPKINNWMGTGFAYSHQPGVTGVPDYADGADPPGAGNWYFTANNQPEADTGDVRAPGVVFQDINVSTGASGAQIALGEAAVRLSAFMSSYLNDNDFGIVHVEFRNGVGASLGTTQIQDLDPGPDNVWSLTRGAGVIPVGTTTLRVSLFGGAVNSGTDGYIDNVDVQVTDAANELLYLHVNTTNGQAAIKNQTGDPVRVDYYEVTSVGSALNKTGWTSLQDQNLQAFPPGDGTGNGWEEVGVTGPKVLSEGFLTGNSVVINGASVGLGAAFNVGGAQDLVFRYSVVPELPLPLKADFEPDGDVDGRDFLTWQRGFGKPSGALSTEGDADGDGDIDVGDYDVWATEFGGPGGPGKLVTGFIHYAPTGPIVAIPEPAAVILAGLGLAPLGIYRRRKQRV
jgi:hypothetical protein